MKLIGMLDSPFVGRCAITFDLLDVPFEHQPLSVFNDVDAFRTINPVVKAPKLSFDDGTCLFDSNLIIQYAEDLQSGNRSLQTRNRQQRKEKKRSIAYYRFCARSL